jgi:hypothetical protein
LTFVVLASGAALAAGDPGTIKWDRQIITSVESNIQVIYDPALGPDGTIYVCAQDYEVTPPIYSLEAIAPDNTLKWRDTGHTNNATTTGYRYAPAVGRDGTIYAIYSEPLPVNVMPPYDYGAFYSLRALNPDGGVKWQYNFYWYLGPDNHDMLILEVGPSIGPDGTIYVATSSSVYDTMPGGIYGISPNGSLTWFARCDAGWNWIWAPPVIARDHSIYVLAYYNNQTTTGIFAFGRDGKAKWQYQNGHLNYYNLTLGRDGTIYATDSWGLPQPNHLLALNPDSTLKWQSQGYYHNSPVIGRDGTIYLSGNGYLYALNPNGTEKWSNGHAVTIPALGKDGTIFAGYYQSYPISVGLEALNPDGTTKWQCPFGESVRGRPVIAPDGTVYLSGVGKLYAVNSSCGGLDSAAPWPMVQHDPGHSGALPTAPVSTWLNLLLGD